MRRDNPCRGFTCPLSFALLLITKTKLRQLYVSFVFQCKWEKQFDPLLCHTRKYQAIFNKWIKNFLQTFLNSWITLSQDFQSVLFESTTLCNFWQNVGLLETSYSSFEHGIKNNIIVRFTSEICYANRCKGCILNELPQL